MIGEILAGLNILEKLGKLWNWVRGRKSVPVETVVTRFVRLFESHGVHRNQIPRFIGHDLTLKDVQDDASLLAKLDEPLLETVSEMFAVRREWLDGAEKRIHVDHDFYKHPEGFAQFLDGLIAKNPEGNFHGVLFAPKERDWDVEALLILQETVGHVGDKPIFRFHICNNWAFTYWKARADLAACVAIAWKREVFVSGRIMAQKEIRHLASGEALLGWEGDGIWFLGLRKWYPEDMALKPDAFLDGIKPEPDNSGIKSALELWLDLEREGLMDTGLGTDFSVKAKQQFQQELEKY